MDRYAPVLQDFDPAQDPFVMDLVHRKLVQLLAKPGFNVSDRDDFKQDIYLRILQSLHNFDPEVGHLYPYIKTVVERYVASIVREKCSERGQFQTRQENLELTSLNGEDINCSSLGSLQQTDIDRRTGCEHRLSAEELSDLRMDIETVTNQLPEELREVMQHLQSCSQDEAAARLGITRAELRKRLVRIKHYFETAGIDEYFRN